MFGRRPSRWALAHILVLADIIGYDRLKFTQIYIPKMTSWVRHSKITLFAMYTNDWGILTAYFSFKLVITSHFSHHMQIGPRGR